MTRPVSTQPDTPRLAYRTLERRATVITVAVLIALAGFAWWATAERANDMDMSMGFGSVGMSMNPFDMSAGVFMLMWTTMMVAMMFPTIAPIVLLHRMVTRKRGGPLALTAAFVSGYIVVWAVIGLIPLAVLIAFRDYAHDTSWVAPAAGAVLITAGVYQFTRWKETCQKACQSPMTFLMTHDFGSGPVGAFRTGVSHGLYCLGCCWALMAVLFVVGLMNLTWMAVIAVVFLIEKHWRHGLAFSRVVGFAVIGLGTAIIFHSALLDTVSG